MSNIVKGAALLPILFLIPALAPRGLAQRETPLPSTKSEITAPVVTSNMDDAATRSHHWKVTIAALRTIYHAEGTLYREDPYRVKFGGSLAQSYEHEDDCISFIWNGKPDCSTAQGAGQWISSTWESTLGSCPLANTPEAMEIRKAQGDMAPIIQDYAMLCKLSQLGWYNTSDPGSSLLMHLIGPDGVVDEELFKRWVNKMAPVWASFPCTVGLNHRGKPCTGTSYYGQGGYPMDELIEIFRAEYLNQQ